jgi:hypothetical protein
MAQQIEDGTGSGNRVKVKENRLYTTGLTLGFFENAVVTGDAYNVNTEFKSITTDSEHALLYLKNNETTDMVIESWFIATDIGTNGSNFGLARAYFNPTGGTIISGGTTIEAINRRGGDSKLPKATMLCGGEGFTATGLPNAVLYQTQGASSRAFGNVKLALNPGKSIVITYKPNGAEPIDIYTGFQFYVTNNTNGNG